MSSLVSFGLLVVAIAPMLLGFFLVRDRHRPFLLIVFGSYAVFYWFRAILLTTGLDSSALDPLALDPSGLDATHLRLAIWSVLVMVGFVTFQDLRVKPEVAGLPRRRYDFFELRRLALYATVASSLCFGVIVARVGSPIAAIQAAKTEKSVAGLYLLQFGPVAAMVLCLAVAVSGRRAGYRLIARMPFLALGLVNSLYVFAWGSRRVVVIYLAGLVLEPVFSAMAADQRQRRSARQWLSIGLVGLLVVAAALGMRVARDHVLQGRTSDAIAEASPLRSVSVAMNATVYDALVLSVRDTPSNFDHYGAELFVNGTGGIVPRAIWADKPTEIAPGAAFRQLYEPEIKNGWPVGAVGEWWLSYGWIGIVAGALISGASFALASQALGDLRHNALAHALGVGIVFQVLELGFNVQTLVRWIGWCASILFALGLARRATSPNTPWQRDPSAEPRSLESAAV
ncbi:MAG: hypothetical protein V3V01_03680 [Acidimicrobiales bacterium]